MFGLEISTSKSGSLWPTEHWKTLIDALCCRGAKRDPRLKYRDLAGPIENRVEFRSGRYFPKDDTPLATHDDPALSLLIVRRVPPGAECLVAGRCVFPSKPNWQTIIFPFFGTIGDSKYEAQSRLNQAAIASQLRSQLTRAATNRLLGLAFTLSRARRDRDLDNLVDGLVPVFNRHCPDINTMGLLKLSPHPDTAEILGLDWEATCLADAKVVPS